MTALRYAVLDADGVKINSILVNEPYPADYWPGYGRYIVAEHGEPAPTLPADLGVRSGDRPFTVLAVRPSAPMEMGDVMDVGSGVVTPAPVVEVSDEH